MAEVSAISEVDDGREEERMSDDDIVVLSGEEEEAKQRQGGLASAPRPQLLHQSGEGFSGCIPRQIQITYTSQCINTLQVDLILEPQNMISLFSSDGMLGSVMVV